MPASTPLFRLSLNSFAFCLPVTFTSHFYFLVLLNFVSHFYFLVSVSFFSHFYFLFFSPFVFFSPQLFNMSNLSPTVVFEPTVFPIRSCIRPIDELFSNCGPSIKKHVAFNNELQFIESSDYDLREEILPELRSTPKARRIKPNKNNGVSHPLNNGNVFFDPYSIWDLCHETDVTLNFTKRKDMINMEYEKALVHTPNIKCFQYFLASGALRAKGVV